MFGAPGCGAGLGITRKYLPLPARGTLLPFRVRRSLYQDLCVLLLAVARDTPETGCLLELKSIHAESMECLRFQLYIFVFFSGESLNPKP